MLFKPENVNFSDSIHSWFGCQLVNLRQLHNLAQCCASPEKISVRILMIACGGRWASKSISSSPPIHYWSQHPLSLLPSESCCSNCTACKALSSIFRWWNLTIGQYTQFGCGTICYAILLKLSKTIHDII